MMRPLLATTLLLAAAPLAAQEAEATLYTRVEGAAIQAALRIEIEPGSHLYHGPTKADLGHPEAVGAPTTLELTGAGIEWGAVRFPEPEPLDQSDFGEGVFINAHEGEVFLYAEGTLAEGATGDDVEVEIKGLICNDSGCMPWNDTFTSEGEGPEDVWDDFQTERAGELEEDDLLPDVGFPASGGFFEEDLLGGGGSEAEATLYVRPDPADAARLQVALEIALASGWHLYHEELGNPKAIGAPTEIELEGAGLTFGALRWPEPEELDQSEIEPGAWIWAHEGTFVVYGEAEVEGAAPTEVTAEITGLVCDDASCVPYQASLVSAGAGPASVWTGWSGESAEPEPASGGSEEDSGEGPQPLGLFLLQAVLWGIVTLLMPCTYPMIPITISFFTKQADARSGNVLPLALAYGAGIVVIFAAIGALVGPAIVPFAQGGWFNLVIGLLFLYFALVLLGYAELNPPRFLMNLAGQASSQGGYLGVFLMGTTLVITSFTCTAPFVGSLLATGAAEGDYTRLLLGMSVFGLTMAVPFVLLSLVPGKIRALPQSGMWMNTLKVTLGFVELAAAIKFFSNSDLAWNWGVISREGFLFLWVAIFCAAALYLLGVLRLKGQKEPVGRGRLVSGAAFLLFAAYLGWGSTGKTMDPVMTAMLPNYSGGQFLPRWYDFDGEWTIVEDDLEEAIEVALAEDKLVFVNFTGHT